MFVNDDRRRRGLALVLVLVLVPALALAAYAFTHWMRAEHRASRAVEQQAQARALAEAGIAYVRGQLADAALDYLPGSTLAANLPETFAAIPVVQESDGRQGLFSIVSPVPPGAEAAGALRFGLESEAAKIPLHPDFGLTREGLLFLPGMTESIADALLDWIDADDESRDLGAESSHYALKSPGYAPRNGPPATLGELLLVEGVTPELLFGEDTNRNGLLDAWENDGGASWPPDNADGLLDRGWAAYLTVVPGSPNLNPLGEPRLNINDTEAENVAAITELFDEEITAFIAAYRQSKGAIRALSDLIDAEVTPSGGGGGGGGQGGPPLPPVPGGPGGGQGGGQQPLKSPWTSQNLGTYFDTALAELSTTGGETLMQIDITQAPFEVLMAIPGMDEVTAYLIVDAASARPAGDASPAWLLTEGVLTVEEFRKFEPYLATSGKSYRFTAVGFFADGGPSARIEAVIVFDGFVPKVLRKRDLSGLPSGYAPDLLGAP